MSTDIITIAENLANNCRYAVFPCRLDKTPFPQSQGFKDAVNDPVLVADLWRRYPGPLIGVATGEASGIDALDIDAGECPTDADPKVIAKREAARAWWHVTGQCGVHRWGCRQLALRRSSALDGERLAQR